MDFAEIVAASGESTLVVEGRFTGTAAGPDSNLYVAIPDFDGGQQRIGPVLWQPRATDDGPEYPNSGDLAIVVLAPGVRPFIPVWEP